MQVPPHVKPGFVATWRRNLNGRAGVEQANWPRMDHFEMAAEGLPTGRSGIVGRADATQSCRASLHFPQRLSSWDGHSGAQLSSPFGHHEKGNRDDIAPPSSMCQNLPVPRFTSAEASYRSSTQDRAVVFRVETGWIVCVADGTGGMSGGARAAELFVTGIQRAALSGLAVTEPTAWLALLQALDREIAMDRLAGETTGIALAVASGHVVGASCGDSRADLSTEAGWQELTGNQLRRPRLGTGRAKARPFSTDAHGTLVVGTDGLFDYAKLDDMSRVVLSTSDNVGQALVDLVLDRHPSPPDDIAVVVGWLD